jgi:uncharacterized metal-binding protein YceD (DUF177 family)
MTFSPALVTEEHPLDIHEQIPAQALALDEPSARADQPIDVELTVQKGEEDDFLVTGWARTTLLLRCARDGELFSHKLRAKIEHILEGPHPAHIDLTPLVREDVLLEIPFNAVCQLTKDGRCPVTKEVYKPRAVTAAELSRTEVWEALSKLKPKK